MTDRPETSEPEHESLPPVDPEHVDEDELVPEDDRIIGAAFKRSLQVLLGVAVLAAVVLLLSRGRQEALPEIAIESSAPEQVTREVSAPALPFVDITRQAGVDFVHTTGATGDKLLPETMGGGVAFLDYDLDDDQDLLLTSGTSWDRRGDGRSVVLYRNDGGGSFEDVTGEAGLQVSAYATGVAIGDVDGDADPDVFVAAVGGNLLLRNEGGRFVDATARSGVGGEPDRWSTSAGFFDMDNDGDLDLFVCNYVRWSPEIDFEVDFQLTGVGRAYGPPFNYEGTFSYLYRNDGGGVFTDVSEAAGIQIRNEATGVPVGKALGLAPVDIDRDGWIDVLVANDTVQNFLFHNQGDGTFREVGEVYGVAYGRAGEATGAMGIDSGHYRNDSELGFAIGNFANEMTSLYISQGDPTLYADEAISEGVGAPSRTLLSFGVLMLDVDLDGRLDLLQANGHLEAEINAVDPSQTYLQPAQLFWNAGPEHRQGFIPVPSEALGDLATPIVGRASAFADIDADGDLDIVITQAGAAPLLLRNDQVSGNHWLRVNLSAPSGVRDAIGAVVELTASGSTQRRQVMPTRSYQAQSELPVTFGLGAASSVDRLRVTWPDGSSQEVLVEAVDRSVQVEKET